MRAYAHAGVEEVNILFTFLYIKDSEEMPIYSE